MKRIFHGLFMVALLTWTVILNIYHAGVYPPPLVDLHEAGSARWLDRHEHGIHHMILQGTPFARGREAGRQTQGLLLAQEQQLVGMLHGWVPSDLAVQGLILGAIAWFQGVDKYLSRPDVEEMYGTSLSAPKSFDYLADGFTRQVAYHGLHEVGQMMVDQGFEDMGCTVVALPWRGSFVIGRNFDFEGGRIFDSEKIIKWVFPDKGYAFVSVIWAGMVGAVTGVNEKGLYISINAAGSADRRRLGTPSTLALLKVLQQAATAEEALQILRETQMFITDIFVIADAQGKLWRVEKSPLRMAEIELRRASIVTNHLISPQFASDPTNAFRKAELTSIVREQRGLDRIAGLPKVRTEPEVILQTLSILRDKGVDDSGNPLPLGNRRAIDALIATHSVIYSPGSQVFYVGQGPAVAGQFFGYDLRASFARREPVSKDTLPPDPLVSAETFSALKDANQKISRAHRLIQFRRCQEGWERLQDISSLWREQSPYYHALGDGEACLQHPERAREAWSRALTLHPAYAREERQLEGKLQR